MKTETAKQVVGDIDASLPLWEGGDRWERGGHGAIPAAPPDGAPLFAGRDIDQAFSRNFSRRGRGRDMGPD